MKNVILTTCLFLSVFILKGQSPPVSNHHFHHEPLQIQVESSEALN